MNIEVNEARVSKDGEEIGTIKDGTCHLLAKVGPTVKGAIRKESGIVDLVFVTGTPEDFEREEKSTLTVEKIQKAKALLEASEAEFLVGEKEQIVADMSDDELAAEMKRRGLIQDAPEAPVLTPAPVVVSQVEADKPARGISAVQRLHDLAAKGQIPQPPAKNPAMGDKTPEYVAWFKTHATAEEIAVRYPDNRRVPASTAEFAAAQESLQGKLKGEKKDTGKENDFTDKAE
jgi:hypothetical protein